MKRSSREVKEVELSYRYKRIRKMAAKQVKTCVTVKNTDNGAAYHNLPLEMLCEIAVQLYKPADIINMTEAIPALLKTKRVAYHKFYLLKAYALLDLEDKYWLKY